MHDAAFSSKHGVLWILLVNFLERFAYYGFRGVIVLFLIDQASGGMAWPTDKTLAFYGEFTAYTYFAVVIGGLCADLILGAYLSTILGALLMALGYLSLGFVDSAFIYYPIGAIALGTGLFKPNILTMMALQLQKFPEKYDSSFTGQYLVVNLGALLGPMTIGLVGENIGWSFGFSISAMVVLAVAIILFSQKANFSTLSYRSNIRTTEKSKPFLIGLLVVISTSLLAIAFWSFFEVGGGIFYELYSESLNVIDLSLNAATVIVTCLLCILLWWFVQINAWYKVAVGFLIFAISWFALDYSAEQQFNMKQTLIFVMILHAIAEVFCSAIFISIIARNAFKPLMSTSFSIHLYALAFANFIASKFTMESSHFITFGWISLTLGLLLLILQLLYSKYSNNLNTAMPKQ